MITKIPKYNNYLGQLNRNLMKCKDNSLVNEWEVRILNFSSILLHKILSNIEFTIV